MSLRIGVIGVGRIGEHHVRNYASMRQVELAGIFDKDNKRARSLAKKYGTTAFGDYETLLETCDAVSICVPTASHCDMFLQAAARGVHAIVEKPITMSIDEADRMIEAAHQADVTLMVGHVERFNPVILTLRDILDVSRVIYLEAQRLGPYVNVDAQVGVVHDLMIHDIDVVYSLMGADVKQVRSHMINVFSETEDLAHAQVVLENDVTAVFTSSRVANHRVRIMNITLKDSYVTADYQTQEVFIRSGLLPEYVGGKNVSYKQIGTIEIPYVQRGEPLRLELDHFVECLLTRKQPSITGEVGKRNLELALRILKAGA